jgi:hypothetical protein
MKISEDSAKGIAILVGVGALVFVAYEAFGIFNGGAAKDAPAPNSGQGASLISGAGSFGNAVGGVLNDLGGMISSIWNPPFLTGGTGMQGGGDNPTPENTTGGGQ